MQILIGKQPHQHTPYYYYHYCCLLLLQLLPPLLLLLLLLLRPTGTDTSTCDQLSAVRVSRHPPAQGADVPAPILDLLHASFSPVVVALQFYGNVLSMPWDITRLPPPLSQYCHHVSEFLVNKLVRLIWEAVANLSYRFQDRVAGFPIKL